MAIGPNTTWRMKIAEWVSATVALVVLAIACFASIQETKVEVRSVKERQTADTALIEARLGTATERLEKIDKWQDEALTRSQRLFDLLYEIKGSVSRIEGQINK